MNSDNRLMFLLLVAGGIFAVGFGLFIGAHRFYEGIVSRDEALLKAKEEESNLNLKMAQLERARKQVEKWRSISLPGNAALTGPSYSSFLFDLLQKHRLTVRALPTGGNINRGSTSSRNATGPLVAPMSFTTQIEGTFQQLTAFLEDFYHYNLPQEIREFTVEPQGKGSEAKLDVHMKVEVLTMSNIPDRNFVVPLPDRTLAQLETLGAMFRAPSAGIALAVHQVTQLYNSSKLAAQTYPQREYGAMQKKNVFAGLTTSAKDAALADKDILKTVQLTSITANYITEEALLRNRMTNKYVKLRSEGGFNSFEIRDGNDQVVLKGKVLTIKPRDLVFEHDGKAYLLHIGQFVSDALRKELTAEELKTHDVELTATDQN
jgi:hypothetical protein